MKKRVLGIVLALVMALTFVPTTAFAADFTDWTELKSGNYNLGIGKYYLTSDVTMNELFRIQSHANVTIDLNGHSTIKGWTGRSRWPSARPRPGTTSKTSSAATTPGCGRAWWRRA